MADDLPSVTSVFRYSYKTVAAHLRENAAEPIEPVGVALGCFGSLWTLNEASVNSLKFSPNRFLPYMSFVVVALVAGLLTALHRYINSCPEGLEAISCSANCALKKANVGIQVCKGRVGAIDWAY